MGQSGSQTAQFYKDVEAKGKVWTIRDDGGFPAPMTSMGKRSMPFWSSKSRAELVIKNVPAYSSFEPVELSIERFKAYWLPELIKLDQLVGINWSGKKAIGYDQNPVMILERLNSLRTQKRSLFEKIFGERN